jgi:NAD(P)-dependent dehydrogenase (short-subunit alcohol dehydrogenase family)
VSSTVARQPRAFWGAYGATKAGMENLVLSWAEEVEKTALRINLFNPGGTATRMRAQAFPGEDPNTLPQPADVAPQLVELCLPSMQSHGSLMRYRPGE